MTRVGDSCIVVQTSNCFELIAYDTELKETTDVMDTGDDISGLQGHDDNESQVLVLRVNRIEDSLEMLAASKGWKSKLMNEENKDIF